ncbi:Transport and Golgi organization protein 2 [Coemansia sp. RSA 2052]|nr:Transport and Golgi organization protein 2 [Coemansia sp. RSA 2052]
MCIVFWKLLDSDSTETHHHHHRLVLAFNRDEFFDRPTRSFHHWKETPAVFAPQDLQPPAPQRGTYLGINLHGHLALLTNFREAVLHPPLQTNKISRGALVRDFLFLNSHPSAAWDYAQTVYEQRHQYDGFNLVLFDLLSGSPPVYVTNRGYEGGEGVVMRLESRGSVVGLSNSTVDDGSWPKVRDGREAFAQAVKAAEEEDGGDEQRLIGDVMRVMSDAGPFTAGSSRCGPQCLDDLKQCVFVPETNGIHGQLVPGQYGTRNTDVILIKGNRVTVAEREHGTDEIRTSHLDLIEKN